MERVDPISLGTTSFGPSHRTFSEEPSTSTTAVESKAKNEAEPAADRSSNRSVDLQTSHEPLPFAKTLAEEHSIAVTAVAASLDQVETG